ncbi:ferritin-like domain-containing protein [Chitinophaga solisilvae]|uniref:ferritin-like domain-containing protein n=1 Tax=Chitinophaga solisilvae TaxID=1233460 RepID=UPI001924C090|nr:ferritin-like domain-containing protein [Chitinophaga solisilvae]
MHSSAEWVAHFKENATRHRINWQLSPAVTAAAIRELLPSLQAWQLGETSEGSHLLSAAKKYAAKIQDPQYVEAVSLFIKEEQKHGASLGRYLDAIGAERIQQNWGDTLFRKIRYFNTSMEIWTVAVIVVESTAQLFYQSLKDATPCKLLQQICTDILIDEASHITFQQERLAIIFQDRRSWLKRARIPAYGIFFYATSCLVWMAHRPVFKAGGHTFSGFLNRMGYKYRKCFGPLRQHGSVQTYRPAHAAGTATM